MVVDADTIRHLVMDGQKKPEGVTLCHAVILECNDLISLIILLIA